MHIFWKNLGIEPKTFCHSPAERMTSLVAVYSSLLPNLVSCIPVALPPSTTTLVTWLYCRTVRLGPTCSSAKERKAPGRKPTQNCTFRGIYFVNIVKNFVK